MDCYMRWKDLSAKYTSELKERTKAYLASAKIPSTATIYNHHWMLAAGLIHRQSSASCSVSRMNFRWAQLG